MNSRINSSLSLFAVITFVSVFTVIALYSYSAKQASSVQTASKEQVSQPTGAQQTDKVSTAERVSSVKKVPDFQLPLLVSNDEFDANKLVDKQILPQKPYLLNVWGSWCIACSREHAILHKIHESGIDIIGVNYQDDVESANAFLDDAGNPFSQILFDEMGSLGKDLGLIGAPESFMIDAQGKIRQHIVGEITEEIWTQRIQPCYQALNSAGDDAASIKQSCQ